MKEIVKCFRNHLNTLADNLDTEQDVNDWFALRQVCTDLELFGPKAAMITASKLDTFVREMIPSGVWIAMGGTLLELPQTER